MSYDAEVEAAAATKSVRCYCGGTTWVYECYNPTKGLAVECRRCGNVRIWDGSGRSRVRDAVMQWNQWMREVRRSRDA